MTISQNDQTIEQLLTQQTGPVRNYVEARVEARRCTAGYHDLMAENNRAIANRLLSQAKGDERRAMILIGRAMARDGSISDAGHFIAYARDLFDAQRTAREEVLEATNRILADAAAQAANRNEPSRLADGFMGVTQAEPTTVRIRSQDGGVLEMNIPNKPTTEDGADPYERIRRLEAALREVLPIAQAWLDENGEEADRFEATKTEFEKASDAVATAEAVLSE